MSETSEPVPPAMLWGLWDPVRRKWAMDAPMAIPSPPVFLTEELATEAALRWAAGDLPGRRCYPVVPAVIGVHPGRLVDLIKAVEDQAAEDAYRAELGVSEWAAMLRDHTFDALIEAKRTLPPEMLPPGYRLGGHETTMADREAARQARLAACEAHEKAAPPTD